MKVLSSLAALYCVLFSAAGLAQVNGDFVGKWVVDSEKMASIDPTWDGVLTPSMWVTSGFRDGRFRFWRSPDDTQWYDPSGETTVIQLRDGEGLAETRWDGSRLVAQITIPITGEVFTRIFYHEGQWLVLEERGHSTDGWDRTYFVKS